MWSENQNILNFIKPYKLYIYVQMSIKTSKNQQISIK